MGRNEMKICSLRNENLSVVCEMKICSLRNENPLENADFKFSVNNKGEDVNKKPRFVFLLSILLAFYSVPTLERNQPW